MRIILHPDKHLIEIDGEFYKESKLTYKKIGKTTHVDKVFFKKINKVDLDVRSQMIIDKIKGQIPSARIAEEVVKKMTVDEINGLYRMIYDKKAKVKRQDGCLGIEVSKGKKTAYIEVYP